MPSCFFCTMVSRENGQEILRYGFISIFQIKTPKKRERRPGNIRKTFLGERTFRLTMISTNNAALNLHSLTHKSMSQNQQPWAPISKILSHHKVVSPLREFWWYLFFFVSLATFPSMEHLREPTDKTIWIKIEVQSLHPSFFNSTNQHFTDRDLLKATFKNFGIMEKRKSSNRSWNLNYV